MARTKFVLWNNYFQCLRVLACNTSNLLKGTPLEMLAIIAYINQQLPKKSISITKTLDS